MNPAILVVLLLSSACTVCSAMQDETHKFEKVVGYSHCIISDWGKASVFIDGEVAKRINGIMGAEDEVRGYLAINENPLVVFNGLPDGYIVANGVGLELYHDIGLGASLTKMGIVQRAITLVDKEVTGKQAVVLFTIEYNHKKLKIICIGLRNSKSDGGYIGWICLIQEQGNTSVATPAPKSP